MQSRTKRRLDEGLDESEKPDDAIHWDAPPAIEGVPEWTEDYEPDRVDVDGRGKGQGWWLEAQTGYACLRWGYPHVTFRTHVWGQEVDLVAISEIGHRLLIQAKDWEDSRVSPADIWRLISLSYTAGCHPCLVITTPLSRRCKRLCQQWRVRVLTLYEILHEQELPRPSDTLVRSPIDEEEVLGDFGDHDLPDLLERLYPYQTDEPGYRRTIF